MVAHYDPKNPQPRRVKELYSQLDQVVSGLAGDRLALLQDMLSMSLEEKLRSAIVASERTHYSIAKAADITPDILDRFVRGERGMNLATASKVAAVMGLELTTTKKIKRNPR